MYQSVHVAKVIVVDAIDCELDCGPGGRLAGTSSLAGPCGKRARLGQLYILLSWPVTGSPRAPAGRGPALHCSPARGSVQARPGRSSKRWGILVQPTYSITVLTYS